MAACSHDMMFTYVYTDWEGTANDSCVFLDALTRPENNFPFPPKASYHGERYHLNDIRGWGRITRKYELFNHRHSSLRIVIERAFGVLKARFPILKSIPNYPLRRQKLIPIACCTLHNFIRMEDRADELFTLRVGEGLTSNEEKDINMVYDAAEVDMSQQHQMNNIRECIADQLLSDYNSQ